MWRKIGVLCICLALFLIGAACQNDSETEPEVFSITESTASMKTGETKTLSVKGGVGEIVWSSTDTEIAVVDGGVVTAVRIGQVRIIAVDAQNNHAYCDITVSQDLVPVPVLQLDKTSYSLCTGEYMTLQVTLRNGTESEILSADAYTVNIGNPTVAEWKDGKITALTAGNTEIKVSVNHGNTVLEAVCMLEVRNLPQANG